MSTKTLTTFRLYKKDDTNIESTIFDLCSGDKETKQTKGFAYILSKNPNLIKRIIRIKSIFNKLKDLLGENYKLLNKISYIHVDAEMLSTDLIPKRRDITISFYSDAIRSIDKKFLVIVIEAKSIKLSGKQSFETIDNQILGYLDSSIFPSDGNAKKLGITLTKHKILNDYSKNLARITWKEIINILDSEINSMKEDNYLKNLLQEYFKFITEAGESMKFYEKEVLSVAAGSTFEIIKRHHIHACPAYKSGFNYKDCLFITFRESNGGVMDCLYKIDDVIIIDPHNDSFITSIKNSNYDYKDRIIKYIKDRKKEWKFEVKEEYRFYILSDEQKILLPHGPKPDTGNNAGHRYYSLAEMLSGKHLITVDKSN